MLYLRAGLLRLFRGYIYHFVSHRACEHNNDIGAAYLISEVCRALGENLALAAVLFAYFLVFAVHSVMTADYYYTQFKDPLVSLFLPAPLLAAQAD